MTDVCGYCLAVLFPRNASMCGQARTSGDWTPLQLTVSSVMTLLEEGAMFYSALGYPLAMKAVTTVRGTLVCAQHAFTEIEARG